MKISNKAKCTKCSSVLFYHNHHHHLFSSLFFSSFCGFFIFFCFFFFSLYFFKFIFSLFLCFSSSSSSLSRLLSAVAGQANKSLLSVVVRSSLNFHDQQAPTSYVLTASVVVVVVDEAHARADLRTEFALPA